MIRHVLVAVDGSEMSEHALEYALAVYTDAEITVLHVLGGPSPMGGKASGLALADDLEAAAEKQSQEVFDRAREVAAEHDREIQTAIALGHPARAIINRASEYDTVVIGSHSGTLAERLFVGNVADRVFRRSPVPVVAVR